MAAPPDGKQCAIHVTNLDSATTDDDLSTFFANYNDSISAIRVMQDRKKRPPTCLGTAFVEFSDYPVLVRAIKALDGHVLRQRELRLKLADARPSAHRDAPQPMPQQDVLGPAGDASPPSGVDTPGAAKTAEKKTTVQTAAALRFAPRVVAGAKRPR